MSEPVTERRIKVRPEHQLASLIDACRRYEVWLPNEVMAVVEESEELLKAYWQPRRLELVDDSEGALNGTY